MNRISFYSMEKVSLDLGPETIVIMRITFQERENHNFRLPPFSPSQNSCASTLSMLSIAIHNYKCALSAISHPVA